MAFIKIIVIWLTYPLHIVTAAAVLGIFLKIIAKPALGNRFLYFAGTLAILSTQPYISDLLLYPLEHEVKDTRITAPEIASASKPPEFIFVLACNYDSSVSQLPSVSRFPDCSLERLVQAAILHQSTNSPIIVTGGYFLENKTVSYATIARNFLVTMGVEEKSIITITKGYDTLSEIDAAKYLFKGKRVSVISSASHRFRIKKIAESQQIAVQFIAVDFQTSGHLMPYITWPTTQALQAFQRAIYEYLAIVKYAFSGMR